VKSTAHSDGRIGACSCCNYYGPPRTVFGDTTEEFTTEIVGTRKETEITGTIARPDKPQFDLQIRLTKRLELPAA
jgi:hypothetical protein